MITSLVQRLVRYPGLALIGGVALFGTLAASPRVAHAQTPLAPGVLLYGDEDLLGFGYGGGDPIAGATLTGLTTNTITDATNSFGHGFPFTPSGGEFSGTDQIFVGSVQTNAHDGYAAFAGRTAGPQVVEMDYSALVGVGQQVTSLTLGIAADDFQFGSFGQPFTASVNGVVNAALTAKLNSLNQTGPLTHFLTIGIDPALLTPSDTLTVSIDQGGDGGDGWAADFFTVGVTTASVAAPEPGSLALVALGAAPLLAVARRRRSNRA